MNNQTEHNISEPCGVLVVCKHKGVTSHDIVNRVRRLYGTRRVGHTGTLDPLATGVLVVLVGRAAKAAEYLVSDSKRYTARMRLGLTTDSEDITGEILTRCGPLPTADEVIATCQRFVGDINQVPPMYSALKVGGQKLVDLARRGETVERQARPITVYEIHCTPTDESSDFILDVKCSSGTYIRTLCADIGQALGCGAVMAELERTETGGFELASGYTVEQLEAMSLETRMECLLTVESLFAALPAVMLEPFYERLSRSGCEIYQRKIRTELPVGSRVRMCTREGHFYALGEVREYSEGSAVKAIKLFEL